MVSIDEGMLLFAPQKTPMIGDLDECPSLNSMLSVPVQSMSISMILMLKKVASGGDIT